MVGFPQPAGTSTSTGCPASVGGLVAEHGRQLPVRQHDRPVLRGQRDPVIQRVDQLPQHGLVHQRGAACGVIWPGQRPPRPPPRQDRAPEEIARPRPVRRPGGESRLKRRVHRDQAVQALSAHQPPDVRGRYHQPKLRLAGRRAQVRPGHRVGAGLIAAHGGRHVRDQDDSALSQRPQELLADPRRVRHADLLGKGHHGLPAGPCRARPAVCHDSSLARMPPARTSRLRARGTVRGLRCRPGRKAAPGRDLSPCRAVARPGVLAA